jgi:hypothetical protein
MIGLLAVLLAMAIVSATGTAYIRIRARRYAAERAGIGYEHFRRSFGSEVPEEVVAAVYEYTADCLRLGFPICADDSLADHLGVVDEDLDEMISELLKRLDRVPGPLGDEEPIDTVGELVLLLAGAPRRGGALG